jgi:hypothetical protein
MIKVQDRRKGSWGILNWGNGNSRTGNLVGIEGGRWNMTILGAGFGGC